MRTLVAIPTYNESATVRQVVSRVLQHAGNVLVVDDGSSDLTPSLLLDFPIDIIRHDVNRGYGRSIRDAIMWAAEDGYDWIVTMDCDLQHEPDELPRFLDAAANTDADILSGSRYLAGSRPRELDPPSDRAAINRQITAELNARLAPLLGGNITDAFCGFKAFRVTPVRELHLDADGYAFPMQFWVRAASARLRVREIPVSLIYNNPNRSFGAALDDPATRLRHYREVMHRELHRCADRLPESALDGLACGCRCP